MTTAFRSVWHVIIIFLLLLLVNCFSIAVSLCFHVFVLRDRNEESKRKDNAATSENNISTVHPKLVLFIAVLSKFLAGFVTGAGLGKEILARAFSLETAWDVILHLNVSMLRSRRDFPVVDVPEFIASRIYSLFETSVRLLVFLSCSSALKFKSYLFTHT